MNIYIWNSVDTCSCNYHSSGGVVVFADTEEEARSFANSTPGCAILETEKPDEVRSCVDGERKVFIMPDAGCC